MLRKKRVTAQVYPKETTVRDAKSVSLGLLFST